MNFFRSIRNIFLVLISIALGICLVSIFFAGSIYQYSDSISPNVTTEQLPDIDVIVCLAGAKGRIGASGKMWSKYYERNPDNPPLLFISGVGPLANWSDIEKQFDSEVKEKINQKYVVLDSISANTYENLKIFIHSLEEKKWSKVLLITSSYHMRRSLYLLENLRNKNSPLQVDTYSVETDAFALKQWYRSLIGIQVTLMEYLKWVAIRFVAPAD